MNRKISFFMKPWVKAFEGPRHASTYRAARRAAARQARKGRKA